MKLTATMKLLPTPEQADALKRTIEAANAACDAISQRAWEERTFAQYTLHHRVYHAMRKQFGLAAQMVVRCIRKVADAYKLDKDTPRTFNPLGAIAYDSRILTYRLDLGMVSIWTLAGRLMIPFQAGQRHLAHLATQQGESDLVYRDGVFYLSATCDVAAAPPQEPQGVLGVDLGIVNIATDSDGQVFSGRAINNVRHRHRRLRTKLQQKGTRAAKRCLKKLAGKEARFARDTNHRISKQIVAKAQGTTRAIAIEELGGIRERVTVRTSQRAMLHSWSFFQLRAFLTYKALLAGVLLVAVDPRNTSRTCPVCGCVDKRNRPSQSKFCCVVCGFAGLADHIAAGTIASRAAVNRPHISDTGSPVAPGTSPRLLAVGS